jgi:flagella basal body P-ring formation protein FlgA
VISNMKVIKQTYLSGIAILFLLGIPGLLLGTNYTFPATRLYTALNNYISSCFKDSDVRFKVEWSRALPDVSLLDSPDSVGISHKGSKFPKGNEVFKVTFYDNKTPMRSIYVSGKIHLFQKVWVSKSRIERDNPIKTGQLTLEEKDLTLLHGNPVDSGSDLTNLVARRTVPSGKVLMRNDLREPYLVERGAKLSVVYRRGGLNITMQSRALQDGCKDEVIWVKNIDTHKRLKVKIVKQGLAVVP